MRTGGQLQQKVAKFEGSRTYSKWDGDILWTMTSSGHFLSKWANFCGHLQRETSCGHFLVNSSQQKFTLCVRGKSATHLKSYLAPKYKFETFLKTSQRNENGLLKHISPHCASCHLDVKACFHAKICQ